MGADGEKWITATMVGNYARQGVIPRSEGKRYGREHAAYLIFVCLSKQVIAIGDIQQLIALQRRTEFNVAVAYDYFCTEMESILAHVFNGAPLRPDSSRTHARETIWCVRRVCGGAQDLSVAIPALPARTGERNAAVRRLTERKRGAGCPSGCAFLRILPELLGNF